MQNVLAQLPLSDDVCAALLDQSGRMGEALHCAIAYERGEWDEVKYQNISDQLIRDVYLKSHSWCREFMGALDSLRAA